MENATKALLMAGAILIAILLISTGIIILRSTKGVEEQVGEVADAMVVSAFNSKFTPYLGNNIPAVQVKSLLSTVQASNSKSTHQIQVTGVNSISAVTAAYYNVSIPRSANGYDSNGYITTISILEAGSTGITPVTPGDGAIKER